jgi:hypothetical protein
MKFPDVREFDESVYQDDSSVNPTPPDGAFCLCQVSSVACRVKNEEKRTGAVED